MLDFIDEYDAQKQKLHDEWENARDRERESRSRFAHHTINPQAVADELANVRAAIGGSADVARFFGDVAAYREHPRPTQREGRRANQQ